MKNLIKVLFFTTFLITNIYADEILKDKILKNLRCLICQGQTVYDSNADFAQIIKNVVDDKIQDGKTEKEIYEFLSDKYGDWILLKPPLQKSSYTLWFLPYILFVMGGIFLFFLFKKPSINKK